MAETDLSYDPLRILIVDDHVDTREGLQDILELDEHHVETAGSIEAALDASESVDVILLDRKLPDGLADEFLPRIRRRSPHADIIVVTGYADLEGTISALREGVSDYLIKPVNPDAMLTSLRRIGKRRRIERELLAERQFANMVLKTAEAIVLVLDREGNIVRFNPYLTQLTDYSLDESKHRNWFDTFIPERDREKTRKLFAKCLLDVKFKGNIHPILTKNGQERQIRWSNTTLKDDHGETTGILSVGLDVTDLIQAQNDLLQSERLAAIGETMTGLAHESRNAMQRLQNALELLEDDLQDNPSALRDLAKIERASNDLRDLLEEVRAYAAPIHLDRSEVILPKIWRRAWADLEAKRAGRKVELKELHASDKGLSIRVDEKRLERIFRNLFENALDACSDPATIEVDCVADADSLEVSIVDNGPGIPSHQMGRAFDAFFTTKPTGTGLGLAIVHRIIDAHGGSIKIEPSQSGAKFVIHFPVRTDN